MSWTIRLKLAVAAAVVFATACAAWFGARLSV
jgi:hypothetical protein